MDGEEGVKYGIDQLEIWSENWQIGFNLDNCDVLHFGRPNIRGKWPNNGWDP